MALRLTPSDRNSCSRLENLRNALAPDRKGPTMADLHGQSVARILGSIGLDIDATFYPSKVAGISDSSTR